MENEAQKHSTTNRSNKIPEDPEAQLRKARNRVANLMSNYGKTAEESRQMLVDEGYDPEIARQATEGATADPRADVRKDALRNAIFGAVAFLLGIFALMIGMRGFLIYGTIILSGIWFVRAIVQLDK